jgi:hydroxyacylglutathione hydrolase
MNITIIPIPAFRDNYIWLLRRGSAAVVVDPGAAEPVLAVLEREGLQLAAILITHHHADHCDGIAGLLAAQPVPVYGPAAESITGLSHPLAGGERIRIDALAQDFAVLAVPGHTRSHLAYVADGALFCGDTLFGAGCGRLFEGTPAQMLASLDTIAAMPEETAIYCAHEYTEANLRFALAVEPGNAALQQRVVAAAAIRTAGQPTVPSTLALELATNPFLRSREAAVIASALAQGASGSDPLAVFTAIREWKNNF